MKSIALPAVATLAILALSPEAAAKEARVRAVAEHGNTVTVAPIKLMSPQLALDYEKRVAPRVGISAGVGYGTYNSLWLRIVDSAANAAGADYSIQQISGTTGANLDFRDFNRGWFTGLGLEVARFTPRLEIDGGDSETAGSFSNVRVGPTLGYKVAAQGGFTFAMEAGLGYSAVLGDTTGSIAHGISVPGVRGMGSMNMGWSF